MSERGRKLKLEISTPVLLLVVAPLLILLYFLELWYPLVIVLAATVVLVYHFGIKERRDYTIIAFSIAGLLLIVFVALPIAELLYSAAPDLGDAAGDPKALSSILISATAALTSTLIGLGLAIPLSYVMARRVFPGKAVIEGLIDLPVVVPHTVAGIALLVVFGRYGPLGEPLGFLGLNFVDAFPGIVVAMLFVSIPYITNQIREGFESVDPRLEKVARSLGASSGKAFLTISLPLVKRNIVSGALLGWARGISEFGAVVLIAYFPMSAAVYIYDVFTSYGLLASRPVAALLLLVSLAVFIVLRIITKRMGRYDKD